MITPTDIAVVVKTYDRAPRRNYLDETIENFHRSMGHRGDQANSYSEALLVQHGEGLTLHQNAARAIRLGVQQGRPWVLVLEDDLDFCQDFLGSVARWLGDWADEQYPMYVFGANYQQVRKRWEAGCCYWSYPVGSFYGAQALCWRREVAGELVDWLGEDPHYNGVRSHGHDLLLQRWGKERGAQYFRASAPSLVQHIGEQSSINNRFFQFPWGGREWSYRGKEPR